MRITAIALAAGTLFCAVVQADLAMFGYMPTWNRAGAANVDFSKYTHVALAFGVPGADGSLSFDGTSYLSDVVSQLHTTKTKALVSVGGWTASNHFSNILKKNPTRVAFLNSLVKLVADYGLDGIDIDWEYPGHEGNPGNAIDPQNDTKNLLSFVKDLRSRFDSRFGKGKLITLAGSTAPFWGPNGPLTNISEFAGPVDFFNLMNYEINGSWQPTTGPNAPLYYQASKGSQVSYDSSIRAWVNAGIPSKKLLGGLAFYGHGYKASVDMTANPSNQYVAHTGGADGDWTYVSLRKSGILSSPTTAGGDWVRYYDSTTRTPWLFNKKTRVYVTYDDGQSLKEKRDYSQGKNLGGLMVWSIDQDYNNELLYAAAGAPAKPSTTSTTPTSTAAPSTTAAPTTAHPSTTAVP
ncbi:hypothetical protein FBU59_004902, partial [Linderina macrospora]